MKLFCRSNLYLALGLLGASSPARGDTVYLKNGAWIDGIVRSRSEKSIEIEIGDIGKVEVPAEEIHQVEKNNRTGAERRQAPTDKKVELKIVNKDGKQVVTALGVKPVDGTTTDEAPAKDAAGNPVKPGSKDAAPTPTPEEDEPEESSSKKKEEKKIAPELKSRIEGLVQDLQKQKPQFRTRAERHLKAIGEPALQFLIPVAKNDADLTRTSVFRLFYEMGDESVIETCVDALLDGNEYVRDLANKTLERVTNEHFGYQSNASPRRREAGHEKWKKWWDDEKREMAAAEKLKR